MNIPQHIENIGRHEELGFHKNNLNKLDNLSNKIDTLSGAANNNIGTGQVKIQNFPYGFDSVNDVMKPLQLDASGHLKVSNDVLEISAENVNLNTDNVETKIQATNDKLDDVKTSIQLLDDVVVAQSASHPSKAAAVGGRYYVDNTFRDIRVDDIGKVIVDSPAGSDINTRLDAITTGQTSGTQQAKMMGSEDGSPSGTQRQMHLDANGNVLTSIVSSVNVLPANSVNSHITDDPANSVSVGIKARTTQGTATTEQFLVCNSSGSLNVSQKKTYSSETSIVSSQSVSGSSTHTTAAITNDANIDEYLLEFDFSGSDITFEILEGLTSGGSFFNALGFVFNDPSSPTVANQNLVNAVIKSPFFKIKFTNGNASARDVNLSFVSINN